VKATNLMSDARNGPIIDIENIFEDSSTPC